MNFPRRILFSNGSSIDYVYAADGTRLRAVYTTVTNGVTVGRDSTDYRGELILRNSQMEKFLFSGGYATINSGAPTFHYYTQDHLGNNRAVVNESGTVEQVTHYYPFGGVFDDASTGQSLQPYKYNGKELDRMHGLDTYDYGARQYYAPVMRWDRVDRFAEKTPHLSPYLYCGANPILYYDQNGDSLRIHGDKKDVNLVLNVYSQGIGNFYNVKANEYGNVTLYPKANADFSQISKNERNVIDRLNTIINNKNTTIINVVNNSQHVIIGDAITATVDIADIFAMEMVKHSSPFAALIHETIEQSLIQDPAYRPDDSKRIIRAHNTAESYEHVYTGTQNITNWLDLNDGNSGFLKFVKDDQVIEKIRIKNGNIKK